MNYKSEKIVPYNNTQRKGEQIEQMFNSIAHGYDNLNRTISLGMDIAWRKKALKMLSGAPSTKIIDIATGTGDLAIMAAQKLHPEQIVAVDLSEGMLAVGKEKIKNLKLEKQIQFFKEDCMNLSFEDNTFDIAMVAFGVRNFENLDRGLSEIKRVLKPNGKLLIIELSTPKRFPLKQGYWLYSRLFIPTVGRLVSKSKEAYTYLPKSIDAFVQGKQMVDVLLKNGFSSAKYTTYTLGVCSVYVATK